MRVQLTTLAAGMFLLAQSAAGQDGEAMSRWGEATGHQLLRFLPDASRFGMSVDPAPAFSGFANETYVNRGANSMLRKYPSYTVNQTWWFDDAELARQMADVQKEKAALKQEIDKSGQEFFQAHGAEMKAAEQAHLAEVQKVQQEATELFKEGKSAQAQAALQKLQQLGAFVYPPYQALTQSLDKRQQELADRERSLANRRRQVSFQIHTNRTPATTAPALFPKPAGTLAGRPFFRQVPQNLNMGGWVETLLRLAVFIGPPGYQNPQVKIGERELKVTSIVVWAWIESRPDTINADEAATRKVLESIDYAGLAKLIQP